MGHRLWVPIWSVHTSSLIPSIISCQQKSCAVRHIPLTPLRAQLEGCIFTLRPCLTAVKLLDFSLWKNSQIGPTGDLKALGGRGWGKKSKELHSLPLIAFSMEASIPPSLYFSEGKQSTVHLQHPGPHSLFIILHVSHSSWVPESGRSMTVQLTFPSLLVCVALFAVGYPADTKGTFCAKMGTIKDRSGMDLTEAEDIKKRW